MKPIRQGDVLIWPCDTIPASATEIQPTNGLLTVALGEATGHHHSFPWKRGITMFRDGTMGPFYVKNEVPVALEHQEHSALTIEPGIHRVTIQRTFRSGLVQRVSD